MPAVAQSNFATLGGNIEDPHQGPVSAAKVQLRSVLTDAVRTSFTNDQGFFEIAGVVPGEYRLTVTAAGFSELDRDVRLEVGEQVHLALALSLGEQRVTVDVVGHAEALKTTDTSIGEVVESNSIRRSNLDVEVRSSLLIQ